MSALPQPVQDLLMRVAQEQFHETEYAGRTHEFCVHCSQERDYFATPDADLLLSPHDADCLTRQARQTLGSIFVEAYQAEQEKARAKAEAAVAQQRRDRLREQRQQRKKAMLARQQSEAAALLRATRAGKPAHPLASRSNMALLDRACARTSHPGVK